MKLRLKDTLLLLTLMLLTVATAKQVQAESVSVSNAAARIDALVLKDLHKHNLKPNPPVDEARFVRRVYLDVIGRIPSVDEVYAYVKNSSPNRRAQLIDQLLESEGHRSHMFNWLADMLRVMDEYYRTGYTYTFHTWLKEQLDNNRPWNEMTSDMLTATGSLGENGATGYLLRDAGMPLDSLSNTLTTFLGANVACAQCHDHPFAVWTQRDFYEMAGFFGTTRFERDDPRKVARTMVTKDFSKGNLVTLLRPNMAQVVHQKGRWLTYPEDYAYDDAKPGDRVVPTFVEWFDSKSNYQDSTPRSPKSLRQAFANWMTSPENPRFATAIANRLWKRLFGVAVQEPVTDLDELSKATNPELLVYLADLMKHVNFDMRAFQRVILNTQTYQRQAGLMPDLGVAYRFPGPMLRRMTAEQAWDSAIVLIQGTTIDKIRTDHAPNMRRLVFPEPIDLTDKETWEKKSEQILAHARAVADRHNLGRGGKRDKRDKRDKSGGGGGGGGGGRGYFMNIGKLRGDKGLIRASELPQPSPPEHFLRVAGQSDRNVADDGSTEGGITESLAFMNGEMTERLIQHDSRIMTSVNRIQSDKEKVEFIYINFLTRTPRPNELQIVLKSFRQGMDTADLAWALINSREFIFIR